MPETHRSTTDNLSFPEVIGRLSDHAAVEGLIVIGSASAGELTAASDYDLVVILSEMRVPLHVGVTSIDGRLTDLIFCTVEQVEQLLDADKPLAFASWVGRLAGWLMDGDIVHDRNGRLTRAQEKVRSADWIQPAGEHDGAKSWNTINYNLQVVRRYLRSDAPLYLATADIRMMLYGPTDLFWHYFTVRGIRWAGEKSAVVYLQEHDPGFLDLFNHFLAEKDRAEKYRLYEQLASLTVAPVGQLWQDGETVMMVDADVITPDLENQALGFWEEMVGEADIAQPQQT